MKTNNYLTLLFFGLVFLLFFAGTNSKEKNSDLALINSYHDSKILDVNQILFPLTNTGNINWRSDDFQIVTWEQIDGYNDIVFDQGLWVLGKINDSTKWAYGKWSSTYSPGPIIDGQAAMLINPGDSLRYRVYKISEGDDDSNPDYQEWPVDFGAPVNNQGEPRVYADQTLWTVYNSLDSTVEGRSNYFDTMAVMPVEVSQTVYAHLGDISDAENIFSNITFLEYNIVNKGLDQIDSAYIGFWTDIDFFDASENPPGIDTVNQLGYCWSSVDSLDWIQGTPPAIGYVQLYGPAVPSNENTAVLRGKTRNNYRNLKLFSFHGLEDDASLDPLTGQPFTLEEGWNTARGFDLHGNIIIDPTNGKSTTFPFSGDPVTNTGWIWENGTDGGAGFVMFSGPFTMAPADTQWVMYALVPGLGEDRFQSIQAMRKKVSIISEMPYDSLVSGRRAIGIWYAGEAQVVLDKVYMKPQIDSLIIQATFPNLDQHDFSVQAIINSIDLSYTDSLYLFDDGNHHDQETGDGIWGAIVNPISIENEFNISLYANDLNTKAYFISNDLAKFTTNGPVVLDGYTILSADTIPNPGDRLAFQLALKNEGLVTPAENISTILTSLDTCAMVLDPNDSPFDDIAPGQSVSGNRSNVIRFYNDCADSIWLSFQVEISSNGTLFWTDTFAVYVHGVPSTITDLNPDIPENFALKQNYPNPFNPKTIINYELPITNDVELNIYNLLGQKIVTLVSERQNAGYYEVEWNASGFASGIYYYMIKAGHFQTIKKMVLMK